MLGFCQAQVRIKVIYQIISGNVLQLTEQLEYLTLLITWYNIMKH